MGKHKSKSKDKESNKNVVTIDTTITSPPGKVTKSPKPQAITEKLSAVIKSVGLPESAEGLTADQLTENQKHALKKVCTKMYGHQHSVKQKMPAKSLESATVQLAQKMKEKLAQKKKEKKKQKTKASN